MPELNLSIVVPVYNEEKSLIVLTEWIDTVLRSRGLHYEIIFVDDGSTDNSWRVINTLRARYGERVRGLRFRRNYGKSAAYSTGFHAAKASVIITMDADLQDSADEIPALYHKIVDEDYDLVSGWKQDRKDTFVKNSSSKLFNWVTKKISTVQLHDFNCGLKSYKASAARSLQLQGDMHRYIPLLANWKGFSKIGELPVKHYKRRFGQTKYGVNRFIHGLLDLITASFIHRFQYRPMHFFGFWGNVAWCTGALLVTYLIVEKLYLLHALSQPARDVVDQPLFYLALVAIIVGVQLFLAGFLAEISLQLAHRNRGNDYQITEELP